MDFCVPKAKNAVAAAQLLQAVTDGDVDGMRALIQAGAECGFAREDVDPLAILMDGAGTDMFAMLNLHSEGAILNAPLYMAAFRGDRAMVGYLLQHTPFDQASLNVALFGAVAAGAKDLAQRLMDEGADAGSGDGACVALSVSRRRDDLTAMLLPAGKCYTAALSAYLDAGRTDNVIELLAQGASPEQALRAVCRQLSGRNPARDRRRDDQYIDAFDVIVSYATGHGDDIPQLLHHAMTLAIELGSARVMERILAHPGFDALPSRQSHLDAALCTIARLTGRDYSAADPDVCDRLADRLFESGADPQKALENGAAEGSTDIVAAALARGADPREHGRKAIVRAAGEDVRKIVTAVERRLDGEDFAAFTAGGNMNVARLRQQQTPGRRGLSVAAAAGKFSDVLCAFESEGASITPADLLQPGPDGSCALDLVCARGQAGLLLGAALWQLRETEYLQVFERMPEPVREELQPRHLEVVDRLKSCRTAAILKQQARANRGRLRLK